MDRLTVKYGDGLYESVNPIDIYGNEYSKTNYKELLKQLGEYEDSEEQNRLLKLPCAVGDTVYTIYSDEDDSFIEEPKVEEVSTHRIWIDSMYFDYDDIGRTVFLTREQAEAALKELTERN